MREMRERRERGEKKEREREKRQEKEERKQKYDRGESTAYQLTAHSVWLMQSIVVGTRYTSLAC